MDSAWAPQCLSGSRRCASTPRQCWRRSGLYRSSSTNGSALDSCGAGGSTSTCYGPLPWSYAGLSCLWSEPSFFDSSDASEAHGKWIAPFRSLFRHGVGEREQPRRHRKSYRLRGLEIDRQPEFGRILHRQIAGIFPSEDTIDIRGRTAKDVGG